MYVYVSCRIQVSQLQQIASTIEGSASEYKKGDVVPQAGFLMIKEGSAQVREIKKGTVKRNIRTLDYVVVSHLDSDTMTAAHVLSLSPICGWMCVVITG